MRLSQVKDDKTWEEYLYRKSIQSHERLRIESGIGDGAHSLADPNMIENMDVMEHYGDWEDE